MKQVKEPMMDTPTVLIVDDDPNLVAGLRRVLMRGRHWTIRCASSGAEALEILAHEPVSVVLSDMQMPEMDGVELLGRVRAAHPRVARIVLSGDSDRDASLRALRVAHRFLSKPTDAADVIDAVSRACNLRSRFQSLEVTDSLGAVEGLPSPPDVLQKVNELMGDPHADMRQIGAVLQDDPALAAKMLQTVNSAFFGLPQRQSSVASAAAYLGLSTVQAIVTLASLGEATQRRLSPARVREFDARAQRVSRLAQAMVPRHLQADAQAVGLLHDIGWLALAVARPDLAAQVSASIGAGVDVDPAGLPPHADVGAYLLDLWGLPEAMVEAVALHHGQCAASISPLAHALQVAVALHDEPTAGFAHRCLEPTHLEASGLLGAVTTVRADQGEEGGPDER